MSLVHRAAAAAAVTSVAVVGWALPASSQDDPATTPTGFVLVETEAGCELAVLRLESGELIDLPAAPSYEACAVDLAVSASSTSGVVYGLAIGGGSEPGSLQAVPSPVLVTYSMDGTASTTPIVVGGGDWDSYPYEGGIAVSPTGTVYVHLISEDPACLVEIDDSESSATAAAPSVCLFTVDPSTGVATPIGPFGFAELPFGGLSWCGGLVTTGVNEGLSWATVSASTGAATFGSALDVYPIGYDCDSHAGSPVYALGSSMKEKNSLGAFDAQLLTIDPATGSATVVAPLSDPDADVLTMAVVPLPAPTPTSTTTTSAPAAAQAAALTPAFTG